MGTPRWQAVAALVDPVRRGLFDYVRRQDHPVTREEAADAQAISRGLAAFHLDKLVDAGLLNARYGAPVDQPRGRGRAPKVYEPAGDGLALTVPQRRYELIGEILADAIVNQPEGAGEAAKREAFSRGRRLGRQQAAHARLDRSTRARAGRDASGNLELAHAVLADLGFEPRALSPERLGLANCPFHALAVRQPELICGLNHSFVTGLLTGLGVPRLTARLVPRPGGCCVEVTGPSPGLPNR